MRDSHLVGACRRGDRAPRRVAPLRIRLLTPDVERRLACLQIDPRRSEQCDARCGQALLERRPNRRLFAGIRTASLIERTEAPRQESVAVDHHQPKSDSVPLSTGITEPPTSMRSGMSFDSAYASSMWMKLWRPILVPCSLTIETDDARSTRPYLTA